MPEPQIPVCCERCCYVVGDSVGDGIYMRCKHCGAETVIDNLRASEVVAQGFGFGIDFDEAKLTVKK